MNEYATAFRTFLDYCDQRKALYQWFDEAVEPCDLVQSFLSIGAGTGEVESELLRRIAPHGPHTVLVEPNPELAEQIADRLPKAEVLVSRYEDCREKLSHRKYDLILLSHSIYYLDDPRSTIQECYDMLTPQGALMIINESVHGIHDFRKRYDGHESMLFSDKDVLGILPGPEEEYVRHEIPGYIETRYFQDMLPFILPKFTDEQRANVRADILEYAQQRYGDYIYQPSVVFLVSATSSD